LGSRKREVVMENIEVGKKYTVLAHDIDYVEITDFIWSGPDIGCYVGRAIPTMGHSLGIEYRYYIGGTMCGVRFNSNSTFKKAASHDMNLIAEKETGMKIEIGKKYSIGNLSMKYVEIVAFNSNLQLYEGLVHYIDLLGFVPFLRYYDIHGRMYTQLGVNWVEAVGAVDFALLSEYTENTTAGISGCTHGEYANMAFSQNPADARWCCKRCGMDKADCEEERAEHSIIERFFK
jgi:hypothetical protein